MVPIDLLLLIHVLIANNFCSPIAINTCTHSQ